MSLSLGQLEVDLKIKKIDIKNVDIKHFNVVKVDLTQSWQSLNKFSLKEFLKFKLLIFTSVLNEPSGSVGSASDSYSVGPWSKHTWCKNPLVLVMIASWTIGLAAQCLNWFPSSVQPNTLKGLAKFPYYQYIASGIFCADDWEHPLWWPLINGSSRKRNMYYCIEL